MKDVAYQSIASDADLELYCRDLARSPWIAFDTEFVAERTYRPVLCLVQVATESGLAIIDPINLGDMAPFWRAVAEPGHETVVHAGRTELEFCLHATGRRPAELFDVQIAAGLIGIEYPAGYGTLVNKVLGKSPKNLETRTDWRRRPLSDRQIQYALDDVRYLSRIRDRIRTRLEELGRLDWLREEMAVWQDEVEQSLSHERWRRVSGNSGLDRLSLAIVRELWRWRDEEAQRRDCPPRRVLRDDLIIELARRQTADVKRIQAVRDMERGDLRRQLPKIAECIKRALEMAEREWPMPARRDSTPRLSVLGQFLFSALGSICRQRELAPGLVGTPTDVRELIAYRTGQGQKDPPLLARGWRAEIVGQVFDDLMAGKLAIRIADPTSEYPLVFEPTQR